MRKESRQRLPPGYARLKPQLGGAVREWRTGEGLTQQALADLLGIARKNLSRIENGQSWPRPDTLLRLTMVLDLGWSDVADEGATARVPRRSDDRPRANQRLDLGMELRAGRIAESMTLREVAARCCMSAAQISRIETGNAYRSRAFEDDTADAGTPREFRGLRFRCAELRRLADLGAAAPAPTWGF